MTTEQITKKSFEVNGLQGAFLANRTGIAFMFFDQDGDRVSKSHPSYKNEISALIAKAEAFADKNNFNYQIK